MIILSLKNVFALIVLGKPGGLGSGKSKELKLHTADSAIKQITILFIHLFIYNLAVTAPI